MSSGRYALGFVALVCLVGSLATGAVAVRARLLPEWRGALARLAESVVGLALLFAICELLGTLGLFRLGPILATSIVVGLGLWVWLVRSAGFARGRRRPGSRRLAGGEALGLVVALAAAWFVLAEWVGKSLLAFDQGVLGLDSIWYHLPWAAWFAQSGQVAALHFMDVQYLSVFYPAGGELVHGLGIVLMGNDVLSPGLNFVWLALLLLAAWCIGAPRGVGPATLIGAALAMAIPSIFFSQPGAADTDVAAVFFLLAAVAMWINANPFGVETADRRAAAPLSVDAGAGGASRPPLALAGIAAGLAISIKLDLLAPVFALTLAVIAAAPAGRRRAVTTVWVPALALAGGFWYLRNLVTVGNPLPWFGQGILPTPHPPLTQNAEFTVWHYVTDTTVWQKVFLPGLTNGLGRWWVPIVAVTVIGALLCIASGPDRRVRMIGLVTLAAAFAYVLTPGTAAGTAGHPHGFLFNIRYAAPALTLGLSTAPLARVLSGPRMRWVMLAALATILVGTLDDDSLWTTGYFGGAALGAAVLVVLGVLLVLGSRSKWRAVRPIGRALLLGLTATLLVACAAAGYSGQRNYLRGRYRFSTGLKPVNMLWQWARTVHHARIAIVGTFGVSFYYPLFGADNSNRVEYVAHHGPHGSFTPIKSCREWRQALNARHFRYVVTSASRDSVSGGVGFSPEGGWTQADRGTRLLLVGARRTRWILVFKVVRPLDPRRC